MAHGFYKRCSRTGEGQRARHRRSSADRAARAPGYELGSALSWGRVWACRRRSIGAEAIERRRRRRRGNVAVCARTHARRPLLQRACACREQHASACIVAADDSAAGTQDRLLDELMQNCCLLLQHTVQVLLRHKADEAAIAFVVEACSGLHGRVLTISTCDQEGSDEEENKSKHGVWASHPTSRHHTTLRGGQCK